MLLHKTLSATQMRCLFSIKSITNWFTLSTNTKFMNLSFCNFSLTFLSSALGLNLALPPLSGTSLPRRKLLNLLQSRPHWLASSLFLLRPPPRHRQTSTSASWAPRTSCPSRFPTTAWPANRTQRTWPPRSTRSPPPWRRPRCCR